MSEENKDVLLAAISKASESWKNAFNSGDAEGCASQYEEDAVMTAKTIWYISWS